MIPKFRAWHKQFKLMKPLYGWEEIATGCIYWWLHCINGIAYRSNWVNDNCELMQWTGYQDKTGKDIYDGDVLKIEDDGETEKGVVRYNCGMFWVQPLTLFDDYALEYYTECPDFKVEIIGNIYENPELIKDESCPT